MFEFEESNGLHDVFLNKHAVSCKYTISSAKCSKIMKKKYKNKKNSSYTNTYNQQYKPKIRRVEFQNGLGCICMRLPATENLFSFYYFSFFFCCFLLLFIFSMKQKPNKK